MSTENKQQWDFGQMVKGNSTLTIFVLSGIITLLAIVLFYSLNESAQSKATAALLEQTNRHAALINTSHAIKGKIQEAFNNYLLYSDNKKETQRIEAVYAAKSARELLNEFKGNAVSAYGPDAAKQEFDQFEGLFADFEETLLGDLEEKLTDSEVIEIAAEPIVEEMASDLALEPDPADTTALLSIDFTETTSVLPAPVTLVVNKKTALASLRDINSQLFTIENRLDLLGNERIGVLTHKPHILSYTIFGGAILLIFGISWLIIQQRQKHSIHTISDALKHIAKGERPDSQIQHEKSFASIVDANAELITYLDDAGLFAKNIGEGNFEYAFSPKSENDALGNSLIEMRNRLQEVTREDKIRNWTNEGQAKFNELLRLHNDDLDSLGSLVISNLVEYLSANQGAIFVLKDEDEKYLEMLSAYANKRKKFIQKRIAPGEGLAGQVFEEGKTLYITDIRTDHYNIETGLGESRPSSLLIVPLMEEEKVEGVIEIASLSKLQKHEIAFVEAIARSIASSLHSGKINETTRKLLEDTQEKAEQMKAQEEELRQNMEELAATQEQMERLKLEENERNQKRIKEMDDYRSLLISILNEIPEKIFLKDDQGRFVIANKLVAENYKLTVDQILGKSDFDFYNREEASKYFQHEQEIIKAGQTESYEEGDPTKHDGLIVRTIKKPFYIEHLGITGLFGVQFDISEIKHKEFEAVKLAEEIYKKQQEIEMASHALKKEKALLDALLNNVPENIYFKDKQSRFIRFSKSMLTLFGLEKPEELIGKSDFDFFSEVHSRPAFDDEQNIIKTGKAIVDFEEKNVLADGTSSWVNTTKMPLVDDSGEIIGTFGISKDITSMKKLQLDAVEIHKELQAQEEELRQNMEEMQATQEHMERRNHELEEVQSRLSEEQSLLRALLTESKDHIYFKDKDSRFIRVSQSMVKLFNKKDESEIIGKSDFDFGFGEHAQIAFDDEQRIIRTGKAMEDALEKETWDDGRITWVSTTKNPLRDLNDQIVGTFGISRDVTKSKRDDVDLKKSKNWLENFFKFHPTGFAVTDQFGKINYISQSLVPVTGFSENLRFEDLFANMSFKAFLEVISFQQKKEAAVSISLTLQDKNATEISCTAISGSQENEDGTVNIYIIQK